MGSLPTLCGEMEQRLRTRKKDERTERQERRGTSLQGQRSRREESDKGVIPKEGRRLRAGEETETQLRAEVGRDLHPTLNNGLCSLEPGEHQACVGGESTGVWLSRNCIKESWEKRLGSRQITKLAGEDEANMNLRVKVFVTNMLTREDAFALPTF